MKKQDGFTLVELVVVIMVLGILAAYVAPKYVNLGGNARSSVVKAMKGAIAEAADMIHAAAITAGTTATSVTTADGTVVNVGSVTQYPVAAAGGIDVALTDTTGFSVTFDSGTNTATFTKSDAAVGASCRVTYTYTGSSVPVITATTTDCS